MNKVYLLYYDTDFGAREEWNTFYTPVEVFNSEEDRAARIDYLKTVEDAEGDLINYEFYTVDSDIMTLEKITEYPKNV